MKNEILYKSNPEVAQTILSQIKALDPMALGAWGYNSGIFDNSSLTFMVNGQKCGYSYVKITLDPSDTYSIEIFKIRRVKWEIRKTVIASVSDVYCDQLVEILDEMIEG